MLRVAESWQTRVAVRALCSAGFVVSCASRTTTNGAAAESPHTDASAPVTASASNPRVESHNPAGSGGTDKRASLRLLPVPGFEDAVVAVPSHDAAVPLLVATHGAGGNPEWECERWSHVAKSRWLVLCPRGTPLRRGEAGSYYYPDHRALEREVTASVAAARAAFGARLTTGGGVYLGYSQGATMGALMVVEHGADFAHLVLLEGGSSDWTLGRAQRFRATGGASVFIACGTPGCSRRATRAAPVLEKAGLETRVEVVENGGHTELGEVGKRAEAWLEARAPRE